MTDIFPWQRRAANDVDGGKWVFPGVPLTEQQATEILNESIPEERRQQSSFNAAYHAATEHLGGNTPDSLPPNAIRGLPPGLTIRGSCMPLKVGPRPFLKCERQCWLYAVGRDEGWLGWNPLPKESRRNEIEETRWFDAKSVPADSWVSELLALLGDAGLHKAVQLNLSAPINHMPGPPHGGGGMMGSPNPMGGMNGGYDPSQGFPGGDPSMGPQQYAGGYPQQQWFGQQGGYPPFGQMQPFDFAGGAPGPAGASAPSMDEERLRFTFPVTVLSLNVLCTGEASPHSSPRPLRINSLAGIIVIKTDRHLHHGHISHAPARTYQSAKGEGDWMLERG